VPPWVVRNIARLEIYHISGFCQEISANKGNGQSHPKWCAWPETKGGIFGACNSLLPDGSDGSFASFPQSLTCSWSTLHRVRLMPQRQHPSQRFVALRTPKSEDRQGTGTERHGLSGLEIQPEPDPLQLSPQRTCHIRGEHNQACMIPTETHQVRDNLVAGLPAHPLSMFPFSK
jgi:hypothetical protein